MRLVCLSLSLLGIFVLLGIFLFSAPVSIFSSEHLPALEDNQKVIISGKVTEEKAYGQSEILVLDSGIQVSCRGCPSYVGRNITVLGILDRYNNKNTIAALQIMPE